MRITTHDSGIPDNIFLMVDCDDSTAVSRLTLSIDIRSLESYACVTYRSGDEWGYFVPTRALLAGLGESSVGRFVATVVKPNATHATKHEWPVIV